MDIRQSPKWKASERNADWCIKHGIPFELYICEVGSRYKSIIWNERLALLRA